MKITIASGKGGTGKTTLSTNLTALLAEKNNNVVLADLDVEEPNSGLFIKGELQHSQKMYKMIPKWNKDNCILCRYCQSVCKFNAVIMMIDEVIVFDKLCHSCYACSELCPQNALPMKRQKMGELNRFKFEELNFVEGKLDIGQEQAVPLIAQILLYIDKNFSENFLKIYDAPPGTSCPVIEATKHSDLIILVTEPTPFGLHDLKLSVETMRKLEKEFVVVINRYGIGNKKVEEYCLEESIPVIAKIPNSKKAARSYSHGNLIYRFIPEIKKEIKKVANFVKSKLEQE